VTTEQLQDILDSVRVAYGWTVDDPEDEWAWEQYDGAGRAFAEACRGHRILLRRRNNAPWECRVGCYAEGALWVSRSGAGKGYPWPVALEQVEAIEVLEAPAERVPWWRARVSLSFRPVFSAWRVGR
jgi:hypothetical protein